LSVGFFNSRLSSAVDTAKKVILYVVKQRGEVDIKRLMYIVYLIDREIYYVAGFTLFSWSYVFSGLRSFDVYDVVDYLVDVGYLDKEVKGVDIVYRIRREDVRIELPKQLKEIVDKIIEKTKDVDNLKGYIEGMIDPSFVKVAVLA
jgi:hypothetical protein